MAYGTAISERYNGNGNGNAAPLTLTSATALEQLRREVETERAARQAAEARAARAERQVHDVWRIMARPGWRFSERVIYTSVILRGNKERESGPAVLDGASDAWAHIAGRNTVNATLKALSDAGLLNRTVDRTPVKGRDGETEWDTKSAVFAPLQAPEALPDTLAPGANRVRSKAVEKSKRNAQKRAERIIAGLECPHCHKVGTLGIVCKCGHVLEPVKGSTEPGTCQSLGHSEYIAQSLTRAADGFNEDAAGGEAPAPSGSDGWPALTAPPLTEPYQTLVRETDGAADALEHLTGPALTGAEAVDYLASLGASFTFAPAQSKKAMGAAWPDNPHTAAEALAHLKRGGNVGILAGMGGLALIDLDEHAGDFLRQHPDLAGAPRIFRRDAPERVKIVIRLEGEAGPYFAAGDDARRKVEYLATRRHGIVAGKHASGATIEVRPGVLPTMTGEAARALCVAWADAPVPIIEPPTRRPSTTSPAATSTSASSATGSGRMSAAEARALHEAAITWANADADIRGAVDAALAKLPQSGKGGRTYYSLRTDDTKPSATWGKRDASRRLMCDHGRAERKLMDDFELWTRFEHNGDKRKAVCEAVRLYCTATGKPSPAWAEVKR